MEQTLLSVFMIKDKKSWALLIVPITDSPIDKYQTKKRRRKWKTVQQGEINGLKSAIFGDFSDFLGVL